MKRLRLPVLAMTAMCALAAPASADACTAIASPMPTGPLPLAFTTLTQHPRGVAVLGTIEDVEPPGREDADLRLAIDDVRYGMLEVDTTMVTYDGQVCDMYAPQERDRVFAVLVPTANGGWKSDRSLLLPYPNSSLPFDNGWLSSLDGVAVELRRLAGS